MPPEIKPPLGGGSSANPNLDTPPTSIVVLVVEDDPAVRGMLEIALHTFGFTVLKAGNGIEALEVYRSAAIDLVLMDVQMPLLDGPQTLVQLRKINADVKCCFMSASIGKYDPDEIRALGATGFLQKPFQLDKLRQLVTAAVGRA